MDSDFEKTEPLLIDIKDLARLLTCSIRTARRMDISGKLPLPVRPSRNRRWRLEEIRQWVDAGCPKRARWDAIKSTK